MISGQALYVQMSGYAAQLSGIYVIAGVSITSGVGLIIQTQSSGSVTVASGLFIQFASTSYPAQAIATTPTLYAVTMTTANTEYSQLLPTGTKKYRIHLRDFSGFYFAYVTGKVATPTDPYETIAANNEKYEDNLYLTSITIYFSSTASSKVAEIEVWT
jgi:hypothetical protein